MTRLRKKDIMHAKIEGKERDRRARKAKRDDLLSIAKHIAKDKKKTKPISNVCVR